MIRILSVLACAVLLLSPAWAQDIAAPTEPAVEAELALLDEVVVTGTQPGPGLWQIHKGERVLYVLGTLNPVPRRMQWESTKVRNVIARSKVVILAPTATISADVGFFGGLALLPKALGARRNPGKEMLAEVIPAELYARWQPLKARYLGRSTSSEKQRPILAARRLWDKALFRSGLREHDLVGPVVRRTAKKNKVPIVEPQVVLKIEDPKAMLDEFSKTALDDVACLEQTIQRVESDLPVIKRRANAWATGDIEGLADVPRVDQRRICNDALLNAQMSKDRGLSDVREQAREAWLKAAVEALDTHDTSFAVLPIGELLREDGLAARMAALGYTVDAP